MLALLIIIIVIGIILEAISLRRNPEKVELDCAISELCTEPGTPFHVQTTVANKSLVPISYLGIWEMYPLHAVIPESLTSYTRHDGHLIKKVCRLGGRRRKKLTLETSIRKRGVHLFRGEAIEFGDFMGLREYRSKVALNREIVVYPEKFECPHLADALGRFCGDVAAKRHLIRDPIITVGSREYTGREPMKEMHWLQSAHRGQLMVREFDYNRQHSVSLLLSVEGIDPWKDDEMDGCCATARTICETLLASGAIVSFFTNARLRRRDEKEIWKCEVSSGYTGRFLEGLGRAASHACGTLEGLLAFALRESSHDSAFVVVLPAKDHRGDEAARRLRAGTGQEVLVISAEALGGGGAA